MPKKPAPIIYSLIAIAALFGIGYHIYGRIEASRPLPKFSFDTSKAPGWTGSKSVNIQDVAKSTTYRGEEPIEALPIADITIHHGSAKDIPEDNCFTMYSYYRRPLGAADTLYKEYVERKAKDGTVEELSTTDQTIVTFEGDVSYQLKQLRYTIEGKDTLQGYAIGFAPLPSGYIRIESVCKTAEDLTLTLPPLSAVTLLEK